VKITNPPNMRSGDRPRQRWLRLLGREADRIRDAVAPADLDVTEHNIRNLYIEVFWAAILSAAAAFNAPFALRLGATNTEIGLLTSIPALLALLVTIPSGQILGRQARRMPSLIWSLYIYRAGFLMAALVPWLPGTDKGTALVWLLVAFTTPAHFFGVGWSSMLADVIPEVKRARVFAVRNILAALATTGGVFLAGQWLEYSDFPRNYQVMYLVGVAASMLSLYYILKLRVPDSTVPRQPASFQAVWHGFRQAATTQPDFIRIVGNTLAHGIGLWLVAPLYVLYFVRTLGANEGWIGLNNTVANLAPVVGYYAWQRAVHRWGENRVLKWTISGIGLYPVLVGLTPDLTPILVWTALNGLVAPGINLSHFSMLLKVCPDGERPAYLGIYTSVMNVGAFIMPLLGVYLADIFGLAPVLVVGGVICLAGSSLFRVRALQTPDSLATRRALMSGG
jgi:MFS family permease